MPDLVPLALDGDPRRIKWVMIVNINPWSIAARSKCSTTAAAPHSWTRHVTRTASLYFPNTAAQPAKFHPPHDLVMRAYDAIIAAIS
ncbi:hypothetical protein OKW49_006859 [Paraburkholderia youngii]